MKTLHLLRHAKSSWKEAGMEDRDRPLSDRGERAAARMGALLAEQGVRPDLILCSSAKRTKETLARVLPSLKAQPPVLYEDALYLASARAILDRLREVDPRIGELLVVGHNPGVAELAVLLAGAGDPKARGRMAHKFATGAWAELRFAEAWSRIAPGSGTLRRFVVPKDLD